MDRTAYNDCMKPWMSGQRGGNLPQQSRFCVGAKLCSGKASSEEEALQICQTTASHEKAPRRTKKNRCIEDAHSVAECLINKLATGKEITFEAMEEAVLTCVCKHKKTRMQKAVENLSEEEMDALAQVALISEAMGTK